MTNNEKLTAAIANIQNLMDLVVGMKNAELYPVSFFSNVFDLIQKIQRDFHTLEVDQVEFFALHMRKHQDLITSIHQQMRTIEHISESLTLPTKDGITVHNADNKAIKSENARIENPKKTPLSGHTATSKDVQAEPPQAKEKINRESRIKPVEEIINQPVEIKPVEIKPVEIKQPVEIKPVEIKEANPVAVMPIISSPKTEELVVNPEKIVEQEPEREPKPVVREEIKHEVESKTSRQSLSLNDIIEKNKLSDLRKAFNLNDRFRYQKELFGGKEDVMNKVITELNNIHSLEASIACLENRLHWDISDPTVKDFIKKLEIRFL